MSRTQTGDGNHIPFEQFDRLLQKLHEKHCSHALLVADEALIATLPTGSLTGAVKPFDRLQGILESLPPERVSSCNSFSAAKLPRFLHVPECSV